MVVPVLVALGNFIPFDVNMAFLCEFSKENPPGVGSAHKAEAISNALGYDNCFLEKKNSKICHDNVYTISAISHIR